MSQKISELSQVKIHLRNEKTKYNTQKKRALRFEERYKEEQRKNAVLNEQIQKLEEELIQVKQTNEEYARMIFRGKSKQDWSPSDEGTEKQAELQLDAHTSIFNEVKNKKRSKDSYKKALPKKKEIGMSRDHPVDGCQHCKLLFKETEYVKRYIEDISQSFVSKDSNKIIIEDVIERWFCKKCRRYSSGKPISTTPFTYGENIRMFINFQITVLKMSHSDVQTFLDILYNIQVSSWEITNILREEANILTPEHARIRKLITQQKWVHFDETGWLVRQDDWKDVGKYAWCMTGTETEDVLYSLWIWRWWWAVKRLAQNIEENAKDRREKKKEEAIIEFVWISDWYGWYTNKFEKHQLCWAHPYRKIKDLMESDTLNTTQKERVEKTHKAFKKIYQSVREFVQTENTKIDKNIPSTWEEKQDFKNKCIKKLETVLKIHTNDPKKLITYKKTMSKYIDKYFVCILVPWIPPDNNKAERALRHLVLKRKMSHGSVNAETAHMMSINYTVLLSWYRNSPRQFFDFYKAMRS